MTARNLTVTKSNKISLGRDLERLTEEDWVEILRAAERGTAQATLMMCYAWHEAKIKCDEKGDMFKSIYEAVGMSKSGAYERALVGSRANELMPYVDRLPISWTTLYELCKIDKDNEQVIALLEHEYIDHTLTNEEAKQFNKLAQKARASSACGGDIIKAYKTYMVGGKVNDAPHLTLDENGNPIDNPPVPEPKPTGGKKAQEQIAEQATHSKKQADAALRAASDYETACDELFEAMINDTEIVYEVIKLLIAKAQDAKDAVEYGKWERVWKTISEFGEETE